MNGADLHAAICDACGQYTAMDDAWTVRGIGACCRRRLYGSEERTEAPPLFQAGPSPMAGQAEMFNPDREVTR